MTGDLFQSIFYCLACFVFCYVAFMYTKMLFHIQTRNNILSSPTHISLDEEDFNCLVRGGVLNVCYMRAGKGQLIRIALKDIGFHRMEFCLMNAENGKDIQQDHNKLID